MTTELLIWCGVMYLLGQLFHLFVNKIPALKKRATAANYQFKVSDYWKEEWYLVFGALVFGIMLIIGAEEVINFKPQVADWIRWFFGFVGYFFNSLIVGKLGQYEKKLSNIIDLKTNTADLLSPTDEKGKPLGMVGQAPGDKKA